jgi:hypothetical protein
MTESQEQWSPYHYVYGNPILRTDPDGRCPDGDCPGISVSGILENTVKDLAVSVGNVAMIGSGPVNNAYRFSRDENGNIQLGYRGYGSSTKEALSFIGSDLLDGANVAATFGTGGVGGAGLLMAKTGGKAIIANAITQEGKSLVRLGQKAESAADLGKQASKAEAAGFPHGVSTKLVDKIKGSDKAHKSALKSVVEKAFEVKQTGNRPEHHTVLLPKPVTDDVAKKFNMIFLPKQQ